MNLGAHRRAMKWGPAFAALILLLLPLAQPSRAQNYVGQMVGDIASLPFAQPGSCQGVISAIQGGGIVERDLNKTFGTNFQPITVTPDECTVLVTFLPMVGSYNDLIVAANQYNPNNSTSMTNFYEKAFVLVAEVTIVGFALDGTLYKASFHATGELNDGLKLGRLRSICGEACYSDVLSSIYWFIKGTASSALDDFLGWAASSLPNSITNSVPSTNQITEFGLDQVSLFCFAALAILLSLLLMRKQTDTV